MDKNLFLSNTTTSANTVTTPTLSRSSLNNNNNNRLLLQQQQQQQQQHHLQQQGLQYNLQQQQQTFNQNYPSLQSLISTTTTTPPVTTQSSSSPLLSSHPLLSNQNEIVDLSNEDLTLFLQNFQQENYYNEPIDQYFQISNSDNNNNNNNNEPFSHPIQQQHHQSQLQNHESAQNLLTFQCIPPNEIKSPPYSLSEGVSPLSVHSSNDTNVSSSCMSSTQKDDNSNLTTILSSKDNNKHKKKRKLYEINEYSSNNDENSIELKYKERNLKYHDYSAYDNKGFNSDDNNKISDFSENTSNMDASSRIISFKPFRTDEWVQLFDDNHDKVDLIHFKIEADKGFIYSSFDDAFICQKKNHFQITSHTTVKSIPKYFKSKNGDNHEIDYYQLQFYGIKQESPMQQVPIKQSDSNRKPIDYEPEKVYLYPLQQNKVTVKRLHFAYTTQNNNRKKNKPNPEQRYFLLIVEMQVVSKTTGQQFTLYAASSDRLIVRAVNPGQYNQELEEINVKRTSEWTNSTHDPNAIYYHGKVGINTERTDEALNVNGNIKLTGNILQPSDKRVKSNIEMIDTNEALENVSKLKLYKYDYTNEFSQINGITSDFGVLAQELKEAIPEAVIETGDIELPNGEIIKNFLHVDKSRVYMECVGAVIELGKKTENLDGRIEKLEQHIVIQTDEFDSKNSIEYNNVACSSDLSNKRDDVISSVSNDRSQNDIETSSIQISIKHIKVKKYKKSGSLAPFGIFNPFKSSKKRNTNDLNTTDKKFGCSPRLIKILLGIAILAIAFGVAAILAIQIVQHLKPDDQLIKNDPDARETLNSNDTSYYPKILPPAIMPPKCQVDPSVNSCTVHCCVSNPSKVMPVLSKLVSVKSNSQNDHNNTRVISKALSSDYLDIIMPYPVVSVILYSSLLNLSVNLSINATCTPPYCEELNDQFVYFVPLSRYIDPRASIELLFNIKYGYQIKHCNLNYDGILCPNMQLNLADYDSTKISNLQFAKIPNTKQFSYSTPAAYFTRIDLEFRVSFENDVDVCETGKTTISTSEASNDEYISRTTYRRVLFRFFRLCTV